MDDTTKKLFDLIDHKKAQWIQRLRDWVEIKSVSCQPETRDEVVRMVEVCKAEYEALGASMEICDNPDGMETFPSGEEVTYPPILLGRYPSEFDPKKKTILIYGHLDVQPALESDGWDTPPFELIEKNDKLYGRGSTDDKGPVLGWLIALESMKELGIDVPVNIKFCFEAMEEVNSNGLRPLIFKERPEFFKTGIDGVCISDNYWLGTEKPCLTYGLRGIGYWGITVHGAKTDLHSGVFGGIVREAMTDLIHIMGTLVDGDGNILIDGISDEVAPVTEEETKLYKPVDFDTEAFSKHNGVNLIHGTKERTLQGRWRFPSLSLHGIEGAFYESGEKTVIPRKVIGKFSIRIVPQMQPETVEKLVQAHFDKVVKKLNSPNKIELSCSGVDPWWWGNPNGFLFEAGKTATKNVYNVDPDFTREGGSIPVTLDFQEATNKPVILLPMGAGDDGAHGQNEKIDIRNYIGGIKLFTSFLLEVGKSQ